MSKKPKKEPATDHPQFATLDRFAGATDAQRLEAHSATLNTELIPRYVGPGDGEGPGWKCQVGRYITQSGSFMQRDSNGSVGEYHWRDPNVFHMLGYGDTFEAAVEMARKAGHS